METTQSIDLIAKLLANEDVNVIRKATKTASFDIVNRTLTLPTWKELTPVIDQMLVAHEVSHALFTSEDYIAALNGTLPEAAGKVEFRGAHGYMNILEDIRVEKLMKRRYLGIRKTFTAGYEQLNQLDFFQVKDKNLDALILIDRINVYFKVGYNSGVQFTPEEKQFVVRAEQTESVLDVINLAQDIYDFSKQQKEQQQERQADEANDEQSEEDDLDEDGDEDQDENGDEDQDENGDEDQDDDHSFEDLEDLELGDAENSEQKDDLESTTEKAFSERVADLADINTVYNYHTLGEVKFNPLFTYKQIAEAVRKNFDGEYTPRTVAQFKRDTQNNVDYLIKEFEMRKAATSYKRAQTAKTGSLNMNKVWSYKLNEDLFKRVTTLKQGKNHGMVFLLDWSGSMDRVINNTIDQLINLATFCHRAQITYQVFAFTDRFATDSWHRFISNHSNHRETLVNDSEIIDVNFTKFTMMEMFSSKMTNSEFNTMVNDLKTLRVIRTFKLHGTPLNESLVFMYHYLETFQKTNNIEKMTLITLTDGQGGRLDTNFNPGKWVVEQGQMVQRKTPHFVRDLFTKKTYPITQDPGVQTNVLLDMIKDRYQCSVIGFYITQTSRRELVSAVNAHYPMMAESAISVIVDKMRTDFRQNGYASLFNTGRNELFVIPTDKTQVVEGTLDVSSDDNARSISKQLTKYMTTKKTSRILLNKFIGYVS